MSKACSKWRQTRCVCVKLLGRNLFSEENHLKYLRAIVLKGFIWHRIGTSARDIMNEQGNEPFVSINTC
jgi:hypothetical protein